MNRTYGRAGIGLLFLASLASATVAEAGTATDAVRGRVDRVLETLKTPGLPADARRTAIRRIAAEIFDPDELAQRALGPHWQERTPEERREFVQLFGDLLERSYLTSIERYDGERVAYVGESVEGDRARVRTEIRTPRGSAIPVEYRLLRRSADWRVYDVVIEGMSLVSNYRAQFNSIIRRASYQELVERLRTKAPALEASPRPASR